ncbi:DUF6907 domain-containing protein [Kitasatospora terrestris]|uniref:Uncharacterized protein n=1 Tax=Kitasatospora terrestris TaxID=258051 RepID=A0ABP9E1Z0_9ACTN
MTRRRVTVVTCDHGPVTFDEPDWCATPHEHGGAKVDVFHDGPEIGLSVQSRQGRSRILQAALTQFPFASDPARRVPYVTVLVDGTWQGFDSAGLRELAEGLVGYAGRLRDLAAELDRITAGAG